MKKVVVALTVTAAVLAASADAMARAKMRSFSAPSTTSRSMIPNSGTVKPATPAAPSAAAPAAPTPMAAAPSRTVGAPAAAGAAAAPTRGFMGQGGMMQSMLQTMGMYSIANWMFGSSHANAQQPAAPATPAAPAPVLAVPAPSESPVEQDRPKDALKELMK